jgi:hypothetical protein
LPTAEIEMAAQASSRRVVKASLKRPAAFAVIVFRLRRRPSTLTVTRSCDLKPAPRTTTGARATRLTDGREASARPLLAAVADPTNNVTYPITMVGSDPRSGGSTTVHTVIVPLKMNFVAGGQDTSALNDLGYAGFRATPLNHTFDGSTQVSDVLASEHGARRTASARPTRTRASPTTAGSRHTCSR